MQLGRDEGPRRVRATSRDRAVHKFVQEAPRPSGRRSQMGRRGEQRKFTFPPNLGVIFRLPFRRERISIGRSEYYDWDFFSSPARFL